MKPAMRNWNTVVIYLHASASKREGGKANSQASLAKFGASALLDLPFPRRWIPSFYILSLHHIRLFHHGIRSLTIVNAGKLFLRCTSITICSKEMGSRERALSSGIYPDFLPEPFGGLQTLALTISN